jgi:hypothetical protein
MIAEARAAQMEVTGGDDRSQEARAMLTHSTAAAAGADDIIGLFSPATPNAAWKTVSLKPAKIFGLNPNHLMHALRHTNERLMLLSDCEGCKISWQEKPQIAFKSCASDAEPLSLDVGEALYITNAAPLNTAKYLSPSLLSEARLPAGGRRGPMEEIALVTNEASTSTTC